MIQNADELQQALNKTGNSETANDLVASFVNYRHPVTTPLFVAAFKYQVRRKQGLKWLEAYELSGLSVADPDRYWINAFAVSP